MREGAETDLIDELHLTGAGEGARVVEPAVVASRRPPAHADRIELTFARQGFPVGVVVPPRSEEETAARIAQHFASAGIGSASYALHVWVPDSTAGNPLAGTARAIREVLEQRLEGALPDARPIDPRDAGQGRLALLQVCLLTSGSVLAGVLPANRAVSLAPGGRHRAHVPGDRPSRSARKLAEALAWFGVAPEPGELCVDLGAAPGGWTWLLLERRARVIAIDPGKLRPDLLERRGLTYVGRSAFDFEPEEPADWLFCDMAWRPLEVARLLSRWGREKSATLLVANFKLPMKRKAETVTEIRKTLDAGGWRAVRSRQLYHDREEITVTARLG